MTYLGVAHVRIMGLTIVSPSMERLASWPKQLIIAWPIAFALTMFVWPASMKLAGTILKPREVPAPVVAQEDPFLSAARSFGYR